MPFLWGTQLKAEPATPLRCYLGHSELILTGLPGVRAQVGEE